MKFFRFFSLLIFVFVFIFGLTKFVQAGFGISPPYVFNDNLTRGSHYEQKIVLVRGDPVEDWQAEITVNVPEINNWISVDRGLKFVLPQGEKQVPIIIKVDVPADASFKNYKGNIRVRTTSLKGPEGGQVAIALGGQIDVELNVVKGQIFDFVVRGIKISDLMEGYPFLWWFVPAQIKFEMQIENKGNTRGSPAKVSLDIYDKNAQVVESVSTENIEKVEPFETKWIVAKLLTNLKSGGYDARYQIYKKNGDIAQQGKTHLSILPYDGSSANMVAALSALPIGHKIIIVVILFLLLILLFISIFKKKKK